MAFLLPLLVLGAAAAPWQTTPLPPPLPPGGEAGVVEVPGARLAWRSYGEGPAVVLLHGGAGNLEHWGFQVPALVAAGRRVVLLDARGHGRSSRDGRPFSYHLLAEDVVAVLDALHLEQVAVVGWSDGGIVGLDLAIHHPGRLTALAITGANFDLSGMKKGGGSEGTFKRYFARCEQDFRRLSPTPEGWAAFLDALRPMWRTQPSFSPAELKAVPVPVLVMSGAHDEIVATPHLEALARLLPRGRLQLFEGSSHFVLWQEPEAFTRAVLRFLDQGP